MLAKAIIMNKNDEHLSFIPQTCPGHDFFDCLKCLFCLCILIVLILAEASLFKIKKFFIGVIGSIKNLKHPWNH